MPRRSFSQLFVLASLLCSATAALAGERVVIVSSDGQVREARPAAEAGISVWPARRPTRSVEAGARLDLRANFPATATAEEIARWARARPLPAYAGAESVIGKDTRIKVKKTKEFPARAVVQILFSPEESEATFLCSGNLINEDTVLTAGHCIHEGTGGGFFDVASYRIYPGRNGSSQPFGSCTAKAIYTNQGWIDFGGFVPGAPHDFGAIKLNCGIGDTTGWFGFFWTTASLKGKLVTVQGYPGDQPFGTQWKGTGKIASSQSQQLFYPIDTAGGQSGSGVWYNVAGCAEKAGKKEGTGPCIAGIHAYGVGGPPPGNKNNSATRLNEEEFDFFVDVLDD